MNNQNDKPIREGCPIHNPTKCEDCSFMHDCLAHNANQCMMNKNKTNGGCMFVIVSVTIIYAVIVLGVKCLREIL